MKMIDVERIVRAGAGSLGENLQFYWPSSGNNEVPENNVVLHVGHAFLKEGFLAFTEAHTKDKTDVHLDLMVIQPRTQNPRCCRVQAALQHREDASLAADLPRILNFKPQDGWTHDGLVVGEKFGLLGGTTHDPRYACWS